MQLMGKYTLLYYVIWFKLDNLLHNKEVDLFLSHQNKYEVEQEKHENLFQLYE